MSIKNTNKLVKIAQSHLKTLVGIDGDKYIPDEELKRRKELCNSCPKNSKNISKEKLGLLGNIRQNLHKPFCTACSCPLDEKQKTPTEECGLVYEGKKPLWNRMLVETTKGTPDLINGSPEVINISNNLDEYLIYVDYIEFDTYFRVILNTKLKDDLTKFNYRIPKNVNQHDDLIVYNIEGDGNLLIIDMKLEYNKIKAGTYKQRVYLNYSTYDNVNKNTTMLVFYRKR